MQKQIRRTGSTALTDSELLILDQIAMSGGIRSMYFDTIFPNQFNCPKHGLGDETLIATLDRFETAGLTTGESIKTPGGTPDRTVRVTKRGGSIWESERNPDWTRQVTETYGAARPDSERHRVTILGHSRSLCRAFFDAGVQSGFFDYQGGRIVTAIGRRNLVYWRPIERVVMLSAWLESWHSATDWEYFEMKRSWWRFADEIGKFWDWPPAPIDA